MDPASASATSQQQANTFLFNCRLHSYGLVSLTSCLTLTTKRHTFALSKEWILQKFTLQRSSVEMAIPGTKGVKRHLQTVDLPLPSSIAGGYTDVDCRALATISKDNSRNSSANDSFIYLSKLWYIRYIRKSSLMKCLYIQSSRLDREKVQTLRARYCSGHW